jgi:ribosomal protein S18 acetylase RimI-like enzyme
MKLKRVASEPSRDDIAAATAPYAAAFSRPPYDETPAQIADLSERLLRYSSRDGFRLTLAMVGDSAVGMALSVRAQEGDWWRDRAAAALPVEVARAWMGGVIREIVHVAVAPNQQRRGVGRALIDDALDDPQVDAVVLSCRPDAEPAQQLYLNCGFERLTTDFTTAPGQMPYWLMARPPRR